MNLGDNMGLVERSVNGEATDQELAGKLISTFRFFLLFHYF